MLPVLYFAAVLGAPAMSGGQTIVGTVRAAADSQPLAGAVVLLLDSTNQPLRRTITDQAGRFRAEGGAGVARLRVIHIGFHPEEQAFRAGERVTLVMSQLPAELEPVETVARASGGTLVCARQLQQDTTIMRLWNQARAGLLQNVVAREARPGTFRLVTYTLDFAPTGGRLLRQRTQRVSGTAARPFGAVSPARIAEKGYVFFDNQAIVYLAPDATVLLSGDFLQSHCLGLTVDPQRHPAEVGLLFGPAGRGPAHVDVEGTIWMQARPLRLDTVTFKYTNMPPSRAAARAGGWMAFSTMPTGAPLISRWQIVMPPAVIGTARDRGDSSTLATLSSELNGVLVDARWPDGLQWHQELASIAGSVSRGPHRKPAPGSLVWFNWLPDTLVTNADGRFQLGDVPPGTYRIYAADPALLGYRVSSLTTGVVVARRDDVTIVDLTLPSDTSIERLACGASGISDHSAVAVVTVATPAGPPDRDLSLDARWPRPFDIAPDSVAAPPFGSLHQQLSRQDSGRVVLCGLTRGGRLAVRLMRKHTTVLDTVVTLSSARAVAAVPLHTPALDNDDFLRRQAAARYPPRRGPVVGTVTDAAGVPVAGVDLWIGSVHVRSDSAGAFVFKASGTDLGAIAAYKEGYDRVLQSLAEEVGPQGEIRIVLRRIH
jgi:hypothetical protein